MDRIMLALPTPFRLATPMSTLMSVRQPRQPRWGPSRARRQSPRQLHNARVESLPTANPKAVGLSRVVAAAEVAASVEQPLKRRVRGVELSRGDHPRPEDVGLPGRLLGLGHREQAKWGPRATRGGDVDSLLPAQPVVGAGVPEATGLALGWNAAMASPSDVPVNMMPQDNEQDEGSDRCAETRVCRDTWTCRKNRWRETAKKQAQAENVYLPARSS